MATCESGDVSVQNHTYVIGGVEISFPYKAYPSQLSMMDKIIKSISKKQNCLLESPTGSGKSLALLCSALAWQKKFKKEMSELSEMLEVHVEETSVIAATNWDAERSIHANNSDETSSKSEIPALSCAKSINLKDFAFVEKEKKRYRIPTINYFDDDDEDFKPSKQYKVSDQHVFRPTDIPVNSFCKFQKNASPCDVSTPQKCVSLTSIQSPVNYSSVRRVQNLNQDSYKPTDVYSHVIDKCDKDQMILEKMPKIFFGTRTHKQISQIIKELKKTPYKNLNMTILSSRNKTCIHPKVSKLEGKTEACDELISAPGGPSCQYYRNYRRMNHRCFSNAWDIEELVTKLKRKGICPYFSARGLVEDSDIVFCPYNYLIDPLVRTSLDINLGGSIVIMDEAHNLEDSARESASYVLQQSYLEDAFSDLFKVAETRGKAAADYHEIRNVLQSLHKWLVESGRSLSGSNFFDPLIKVYAGEEMVALLETMGAGPSRFKDVKKFFGTIVKEESEVAAEEGDETEDKLKLSGSTLLFLKGLLTILDYMYRDDMKYLRDYRCVIQKKKVLHSTRERVNRSRYNDFELSFNFWCLSPAVAFSDLKGCIHNIIVTSGTLSPMSSFQSELGLPFEIILETNHVISSSQMWVGTIGQGPKHHALNATFANTETFAFQDEVGNLILEICSIIPHGVLCFLPSYAMLDKLTQRWQTTGLWQLIMARKIIVCEPRGQSQNFEAVMEEFYDAVRQSESNLNSEISGALFIAVCRGKVSEGLDFSDNNARAVITIGIPFPNVKDSQVDLKKKYNNSLCSSNGILSGNDWYEIQAFRALNQALGRCIRHRNDFGALIIVDERFQKQMRYISLLSKWIRKEVVHFQNFRDAMDSLKHFYQRSGLTNGPQGMIESCSCVE